jgi:serine/threonine protein kinase
MGNCQSLPPRSRANSRKDAHSVPSPCPSSLGLPSGRNSPSRRGARSPATEGHSTFTHSPSQSEICDEVQEGDHTCVGHYQIFNDVIIGEGKYSSVRACSDRNDTANKDCIAAKVVDKQLATPQQLQRLRKEIALLSQIRHHNIAQFVHAYETHDHVYLLMTRVNGGSGLTLLQELQEHKLPEKKARRYFRQLVEAVAHLHSHGVVHRDLKLENILYRESDDSFVLADFGFAVEVGANNLVETSCGTVCYAAPELFTAGTYDGCAADIWALGVILHAMVAGKLPFDCPDDDVQTIMKIEREVYTPPQGISAPLAKLLVALLNKNPQHRPTIEDVLTHPWVRKNGLFS